MPHLPETMKCIEISQFGGPDVLRFVARPLPVPRRNEVLVRVEAAGVNRPDVMQRMGKYPPPPGASDLPGLEVAGTVAAVADGVQRWTPGDRVCGLVAGGGYAEYCVVPAPQCLPIPEGMTAVAAAAVPETFFTVWTNLFQRAHLAAGECVLVQGGTSGIGTTAIQLANAFGATVHATAGSDEKCDACRTLGATGAINYRTTDFVAAIKEATGGRGVDVILDIVGGHYFARNISCLALHGRLVQIGLIGGSRGEIDLRLVLLNRLTITGSTLRVRTVEEKGEIARELEGRVWPLLASAQVAPVIHRTFALERASDAHREIEAGTHIGKIVLTVR